jgi:MarR family transcriptional regulator, transcriptional regulator for hemolysin
VCTVFDYAVHVRPTGTPIGLRLFTASKAVRRAFDRSLAAADGSIPMWLVLTNLKSAAWRSQNDLAAAVGIEGPTLTRHLDALERQGLVRRRQDPSDRRAVVVELTDEGHAAHARLREVVIAFDRRLRSGLSQDEVDTLRELLGRLEANVETQTSA